MKEKPILFNGNMVRAILEGRKTETRRVAKDVPNYLVYDPIMINGKTGYRDEHGKIYKCPYGQPGDRLWVRETFSINHSIQYSHDHQRTVYRASWEGAKDQYGRLFEKERRWRPSIHMPRWASRILLEITDVSVENVQSITYISAKDEGVNYERGYSDPRDSFKRLWNSINAKRGYSWQSNPLVWVVKFKVIEIK